MSVIFRFPGCLCLGGFLAFSGALWGQTTVVVPQGTEFSILGSSPGDQVWPTVSLSPTGGCITWQDSVINKTGGGLGSAILNTSFQPSPTARVNATASGIHLRPKVQLLPGDNVLYVWESTVTGRPNIYARFAKNAAPKKSSTYGTNFYGTNFYTGDIQVNTYVSGHVADPVVAALPDGSAIVAWSSYGQDGSMYGVYARRLKSTGAGTTAKEFKVNQFTQNNQRNPAVTALPNGNYVIAWISEHERTATSVDVYARIFTDAGVPLTDEIAVNSGTAPFAGQFYAQGAIRTDQVPVNSGNSPCSSPAIAPLGDGGFTVVWAQKDTVVTTNGWDIWGRAFSPNGMPLAHDFGINTYLYGDQFQPKIAAGPAGSLVVWTSLNQDGSREGVYGRFLAGGTTLSGDEFRVNTTTISKQMHPSVAWDGVGRFLVVWTSFAGENGFDLFGQTYVVNSSQ